jgi:hypothetical protein
MSKMRNVSYVLLSLLVLVAGCSSGLKGQITGKWEPQEDRLKGKGVVTEITANEIRTSGQGSVEIVSPYRFLDDATIESETTMFGKKFKNKYKVAINGDDMTWTDEKGVAKKFTRIK